MALQLPRLLEGKVYIDEQGRGNMALRHAWQLLCENIEAEFGAVQAAIDAQAAADDSLGRIQVEADYPEVRFGKGQRQGKADVALPDDAHHGLAVADA